MIPQGAINLDEVIIQADESEEDTLTYEIDIESGKLTGRLISGIAAVRQNVAITLLTERYKYSIYDDDHGTEYVIGEDRVTFEIETKQRIEESLLMVDNVTAVDEFNFEYSDDEALVTFIVHSEYGDFNANRAVNRGV
ncbi:DUF2634 domain-containing protein [Paenibacillus shunpengii]|uniref:DUF2634 domain-containing protein n=1 Tax=Paenibacillus shunpengii TaxID=2054424 RepID=A0ABW5SWZ9_9BACL